MKGSVMVAGRAQSTRYAPGLLLCSRRILSFSTIYCLRQGEDDHTPYNIRFLLASAFIFMVNGNDL